VDVLLACTKEHGKEGEGAELFPIIVIQKISDQNFLILFPILVADCTWYFVGDQN